MAKRRFFSTNIATAILLFAHGSRVEEANLSVRELAREVERQGPYTYVREAFLELAAPDLATVRDNRTKSSNPSRSSQYSMSFEASSPNVPSPALSPRS